MNAGSQVSRIASTLKFVHDVVLFVAAGIVLISLVTYVYVLQRSIDDYLDYVSIVPTQSKFFFPEVISFYSFSISKEEVDVQWNDILYCDFGEGYEFVSSQVSNAQQFWRKANRLELVEKARSLMAETSFDDFVRKDKDQHEANIKVLSGQLRYLASANDYPRWLYSSPGPSRTAMCKGVHYVSVETPFFHIKKYKKFEGPPFSYIKWR